MELKSSDVVCTSKARRGLIWSIPVVIAVILPEHAQASSIPASTPPVIIPPVIDSTRWCLTDLGGTDAITYFSDGRVVIEIEPGGFTETTTIDPDVGGLVTIIVDGSEYSCTFGAYSNAPPATLSMTTTPPCGTPPFCPSKTATWSLC